MEEVLKKPIMKKGPLFSVVFIMGWIIFLCPFVAYSGLRDWKRIEIPAARCGDGSPYSISVSHKDSSKITFFFQGGGACWDYDSCYGLNRRALMWIPNITLGSTLTSWVSLFLSDQKEKSPVAEDTVVYFPYCTGDVYSGMHTADYTTYFGSKSLVYHWGKFNIEKAMEYLKRNPDALNIQSAKKIVVYGYSAGALGAIFNMKTIEQYLNPDQEKVALLDAPGMHFDASFYGRFSEQMLKDIGGALDSIGIKFDKSNANYAKHAPEVCAQFSQWRVGILQDELDPIMSYFGGVWPQSHKEMVNGEYGIRQALNSTQSNCSVWISSSYSHTFLMSNFTAGIMADGKTALEYANEVINSP